LFDINTNGPENRLAINLFTGTTMNVLSSGSSNIGRKRKTNQDSIHLDAEKLFFVVADGMGGHLGGDVASKMAITHVSETFKGDHTGEIAVELKQLIESGNDAIYQRSHSDPKLKGMGTTFVGVYFKGDKLFIVNIGDSRAYLIKDQKIFQITKDHSLVQEKINFRICSREEARLDPMKNVLSRTVGYSPDVVPDFFRFDHSPGDILLLCSDGLHSMVSDEDVLFLVNRELPSPLQASQAQVDKTVNALIEQANANGGQDNVSVILAVVQ
jgi:protein phosphatase